jgi:hypothetical protein
MLGRFLSEPATLSDFVQILSDHWFVLPQRFRLPADLSIAIFSNAPDEETPRGFTLLLRAWNVEILSSSPPSWPREAIQAERVDFDGHWMTLVGAEATIRIAIDIDSRIILRGSDSIVAGVEVIDPLASLKSNSTAEQTLSAFVPTPGKAFIGPPTGPIFTPPREYYVSRELKSLLGLVAGIVLVALGLLAIYASGARDVYAWIFVTIGAWIVVATVLDVALFPPLRR